MYLLNDDFITIYRVIFGGVIFYGNDIFNKSTMNQ